MGLKRYVDRAIVRFHTPGHRGGRWAHPQWIRTVGEKALSLDMSDVLEGESGERTIGHCFCAPRSGPLACLAPARPAFW